MVHFWIFVVFQKLLKPNLFWHWLQTSVYTLFLLDILTFCSDLYSKSSQSRCLERFGIIIYCLSFRMACRVGIFYAWPIYHVLKKWNGVPNCIQLLPNSRPRMIFHKYIWKSLTQKNVNSRNPFFVSHIAFFVRSLPCLLLLNPRRNLSFLLSTR